MRGLWVSLFFWFCAPLLAAEPHGRLLLEASVHASSAPVPVYEMANGWGSQLRDGDYAYADARLLTALEWQGWRIGYEVRQYYNLTFSEDTARFYFNTENNISSPDFYNLDLQVQALTATGIRAGKRWQLQGLTIMPQVTLYRVTAFQFGELSGRAQGNNGLSVSALLDYHYDEDKILNHQADVGLGQGGSVDLALAYEHDGWQLALHLQDLLNRWYFSDAAFTRGCVNLAGQGGAVCTGTGGSASGTSGQEVLTTQIPLTLQGEVAYQPYGMALGYYQHDRYQRLSARKNWTTAAGELGVSLHSTAQLGLHWDGPWHRLSVLSDDRHYRQAHHLQLGLTLMLPW